MDDPNQATNIELELEKQFQQTDVFIHRYLELINEYGHLPDCDTIIMPKLTTEFGKEMVDDLLGDEPWEDNDLDMGPLDNDDPFSAKRQNTDGEPKKQSALEEYSSQAASLLISALLGWCNIYGMDLMQKERLEAMKILYLLSKTFSFLMQAFDAYAELDYIKAIVLIQRCKRFAFKAKRLLKEFHVQTIDFKSPFDNIIECLDDSIAPLNKVILEYRHLDQNDLPF